MRKITNIFCLLALGSTLTSCLNDKLSLDPANSTNVIEFKNPTDFSSPFGSKYALYNKAFDVATENDYPLTVSYSGANVAPEDITVTFGTNPTALTQYNSEQAKSFDLMPSTLYTLPGQVTIPKGQRTAVATVKVKSANFDFSKNYVLPIQIQSASSGIISGNFGTILINMKAKNSYDGTYTSTGTFNHPTAGKRDINRAKTLTTVNANTVETEFADLGGNGWTMQLRINSDNTVTLIPTGSASTGTKQTGTNTYNPTTKTFTLNYSYSGGGGDRVVSETIKRN